MHLVLSDLQDTAALWLVSRLRATGVPCAHVTSQALSFAARRTQHLHRGGTESVVEVGDVVIDRPALVVNRMVSAPDGAWRSARPAERDYATAELTAFVLSWLQGLPGPVRNRADPACLAGPSPHPLRAAVTAAQAGLAVPDIAFDSAADPPSPLLAAVRAATHGTPVHAVVCDGRLLGRGALAERARAAIPASLPGAVRQFAATVGAAEALIGVDFVVDGDRWIFGGMTPLPDLPMAGDDVVAALADLAAHGAEAAA